MRSLTSIIFFFINCIYLLGQNHYYDTSFETKVDTSTYVCNVDESQWVKLYNKDYKFGPECTQIYKDTNEEVQDTHDEWFEDNPLLFQICNNIWIKAVLPYVSKEEANGAVIEIYVDSNTGHIADVVFSFTSFSAVAKIPISVYRKIELDLKDKLKFSITNAGKNVNYIYLMYLYHV